MQGTVYGEGGNVAALSTLLDQQHTHGVAIPVTTSPKRPPGQPEDLATLMRNVHQATSELCAGFLMAREEQGDEAAKTHTLLRKINARMSGVEVRLMALEARISASEDVLFGEDEDEG